MSPAPSISGTAKFASPANAGITNRKIISDAWTEKRPLNVCVSKNCMPGRASSARTSIASRPPIEEEEDRRDEVLDADHLVVGVDAEVVLPACARRGSNGPPAASACRARSTSSSRTCRCRRGSRAAPRRGARRGRSAASRGSAASCPTSAAARRCRSRSRRGARVIQAARIQPAPRRAAARCRACGGRARGRVVVGGRCGHVARCHPFLLDWIRYWTSASSWPSAGSRTAA